MQQILRTAFTLAGIAAVLLTAPSVRAAEDPLNAFPSSMSMVLRLKNPEAVFQKLDALSKKLELDAGWEWGVMAKSFLGTTMMNPDLDGVAMDSEWWFGVFLKAEGEPTLVFAIPAADAKAMKLTLPEDISILVHERWVIYTSDSETAKLVQAQVKSKDESVRADMTEQSRTVLNKGDLSLFINVPAIREVYAAQIEEQKSQLPNLLNSLFNDVSEEETNSDPTVQQMAEFLIQLLADAQSWSFSAALETGGIRYEDYLQVREDSPTGEFFKQQSGMAFDSLNELPAGEVIYVGVDDTLFKATQLWTVDAAIAAQVDQQAKSKLQAIRTALAAMTFGEYAMSVTREAETGKELLTTSTKLKEPQPYYRVVSRKLPEALTGIEREGVRTTFTAGRPEKFGALAVDVIQEKSEYRRRTESNESEGEETVEAVSYSKLADRETRLACLKDRVLTTDNGGKAAMQRAVDNAQGRAKPDAKLAAIRNAARKQLSPQAQLIVLVDFENLMDLLEGEISWVSCESTPRLGINGMTDEDGGFSGAEPIFAPGFAPAPLPPEQPAPAPEPARRPTTAPRSVTAPAPAPAPALAPASRLTAAPRSVAAPAPAAVSAPVRRPTTAPRSVSVPIPASAPQSTAAPAPAAVSAPVRRPTTAPRSNTAPAPTSETYTVINPVPPPANNDSRRRPFEYDAPAPRPPEEFEPAPRAQRAISSARKAMAPSKSYVGYSLSLESGGVRSQVYVPTEQVGFMMNSVVLQFIDALLF